MINETCKNPERNYLFENGLKDIQNQCSIFETKEIEVNINSKDCRKHKVFDKENQGDDCIPFPKKGITFSTKNTKSRKTTIKESKYNFVSGREKLERNSVKFNQKELVNYTISDYSTKLNFLDLKEKSCCRVCKNAYNENDKIIKCFQCLQEVHHKCYGSELIEETPVGEWYCQKCKYLIENCKEEDSIKCYFCPNLKGIMKNLIIKTYPKNNLEKIWSHITCVNWLMDASFVNEKNEEITLNIKTKYGKYCSVCYSNKGRCIKCDYIKCQQVFHVSCAQKIDIIDQPDKMNLLTYGNGFIPVFCKYHKEIIYSIKKNYLNDEANLFLTKYLKNGYGKEKLYIPNKSFYKENNRKIKNESLLKSKRKKDLSKNDLVIKIKLDDGLDKLTDTFSINSKKKKKENLSNKKRKSKLKDKDIDIDTETSDFKLNNSIPCKMDVNDKKEDNRFMLKKEMKFFLGYKEDTILSLNELYEIFLKMVKKLKCYDYEREYILIFQSQILTTIFNKEIIQKNNLKDELRKFLLDCSQNCKNFISLSEESKSLDDSSDEAIEEMKINHIFEETSNGWNISNTNLEENIKNILIHSSYVIINRQFFRKDLDGFNIYS